MWLMIWFVYSQREQYDGTETRDEHMFKYNKSDRMPEKFQMESLARPFRTKSLFRV